MSAIIMCIGIMYIRLYIKNAFVLVFVGILIYVFMLLLTKTISLKRKDNIFR